MVYWNICIFVLEQMFSHRGCHCVNNNYIKTNLKKIFLSVTDGDVRKVYISCVIIL